MPGNEAEDHIYNVYELDNSSQNQHISRGVGGNWPVLDYNHWVGNPQQIGGAPNLNLKNHTLPRLDSTKGHNAESLHMPLNQSYTQWTPGSEYSRGLAIRNQLNTNETLAGRYNFQPNQNQNQQGIYGESAFFDFKSQPDNECIDSPTLTTNSERSEITEASVDYSFHRGNQQFVREKEVNVPKPQKMQQPSGYNDMQVLQQHMMFKQLQEFQRQQQQQNPLNQFSVNPRQVPGAQFSPLINGTPVHDAQHMLMNWMQQGAAPGASNKVMFPPEQGQAMLSMGLTPQQNDVSLYGTPVSNTRGNISQYPHFQGMPHNSLNMLAKAGGQAPKSSGFGSPSSGDQHAVSDFVSVPQGALMPKQELPIRGLNSGNFPGNLQERKAPHVNTSTKHEQGSWSAIEQTKQLGSSQGLDPMEAKILYNMDENIWDAFGSRPETGAPEHPDSFSSIQGGTWSALMQSAVAEASSSDTGIKEEWSGLTFQNTEQSTHNPVSNFMDSERQQTTWLDNNLQSGSSISSKPFPMVNDSSTSSSFPGFHQSGMQLLTKQREDYRNDSSHESAVNSQKPAIHWTGQMFEHSQAAIKHEKGVSSGISNDKSSDNMVKIQHQMSNGPHVSFNSYKGAHESQEKQLNRQQRENSNNSFQGHHEQLKFFDNFSRSPMNLDKGSAPNFQGSPRASEEVPSRGDHGSNASTSFHGSVLPEGSNISSHTSEHMLELLHKVDQSKDEMHGADSRDTSIAQMHSQSSASQGFGLRLAPPYQKLANPNSVLTSVRSPLVTNDLNSRQVKAELEEKSQAWHNSSPSSFNSSSPSHEVAQRTHFDNRSGSPGPTTLSRYANMQGNSAVSFSTNQASLPGNTSRFSPFNQVLSQDTSQQMNSYSVSQPFPVLDTMPISHHSNLSGMAQPGENSSKPYYVWRNVPIQRQPFSNLSSSMESPNNNMSSTSWAPVEQNSVEEGNKSSEVSTSSNLQGYDHMEELTGKEMLQQHISANILDTSSAQGQENISGVSALNSGLSAHVQQQHVDKIRHTDMFSQASQRNLESISHNYALSQASQALGGQQLHDNISRFRHLVDGSRLNSFPSGDAQVVSPAPSQAALHSRPPQEIVAGGYNDSQTQSSTKNVIYPHMLPSEVTNQVALMRPKKRKIMTLELRPWHKEVMQDSGRLQHLSVAEQDWAQATNRLPEKVEDEVEEVQPIRRSKRRLVLTTQLLQQLFLPAPASIFSGDASTNYGIISYFISRLSLGDACSFSHSSVKDFLPPLTNSNLNSEKPKIAESNSQKVLEVVNNLSERTKKLENDFQRLDRTASIAIIRAEILELERFTVINRFAKFHVRGQMDVSGSSLTGGVLQRHIIAIPMPQNLPEGVQCLSL